MQCLELFAGAGGAALGIKSAGIQPAALVEIDPAACSTLRAAGHSPVIQADVRNIKAISNVVGSAPVDVIWSSFPCQAWSLAGSGKGASDQRNGWPWTLQNIDAFKPKWFLAENVKGLASHVKGCQRRDPASCPGCYLDNVIMPALRRRFWACGYWILDAASYGVPQHRRRVIIWAGPSTLTAPKSTHGPGLLPYVSMGEALGMSSVIGRRTLGIRSPQMLSKPAPTVATTEVKGTRATQGSRWSMNGGPDRASDALWLATGRRRLTVAECAKLQGFPAGYRFVGTKEQQYRQIGNAVPPAMARAIALALPSA